MKITKLEVIKVKPRWMFLKMHTDTDIYGLGEPVLEGHCNAVEAAIKEFEEYLIGKGEDITTKGYPFYPGPVEYLLRFHLDVDPSIYSCAVLKIGRYNGCSATVSIDGKKIGYIDREPYELTINRDVLHAGDNEVKIKLLGSFRNMFGPSHFLDYDPTGCSRVTWYEDYENTDCTEYDKGSLTNSFQLVPYGIGDVSLRLYF